MRYFPRTIFLFSFILLTSCIKSAPPAGPPPVTEKDILKFETIVQQPSGEGPFPLLIIAPGKKYTMDGDLFSKLARKSSKEGFLVIRFNWPFVTQGKGPSADLKEESETLDTILRYFTQKSFVDKERVFVIAKSMGSQVLMKKVHAKSNGVVLLTPNCNEENPFKLRYGPLLNAGKPVQILISRDDPYCPTEQILTAMIGASNSITPVFLRGDHNFILPFGSVARNQDAAIEAMASFLSTENSRILEDRKKKKKEAP